MRRLILLVAFAFVAWLILAPAAVAQEEESMMEEQTVEGPSMMDQSQDQAMMQPQMMEQQPQMMEETMTMEKTMPLPKSGGPAVGSVLLPASALLLGSGLVAYAVLRRRR